MIILCFIVLAIGSILLIYQSIKLKNDIKKYRQDKLSLDKKSIELVQQKELLDRNETQCKNQQAAIAEKRRELQSESESLSIAIKETDALKAQLVAELQSIEQQRLQLLQEKEELKQLTDAELARLVNEQERYSAQRELYATKLSQVLNIQRKLELERAEISHIKIREEEARKKELERKSKILQIVQSLRNHAIENERFDVWVTKLPTLSDYDLRTERFKFNVGAQYKKYRDAIHAETERRAAERREQRQIEEQKAAEQRRNEAALLAKQQEDIDKESEKKLWQDIEKGYHAGGPGNYLKMDLPELANKMLTAKVSVDQASHSIKVYDHRDIAWGLSWLGEVVDFYCKRHIDFYQHAKLEICDSNSSVILSIQLKKKFVKKQRATQKSNIYKLLDIPFHSSGNSGNDTIQSDGSYEIDFVQEFREHISIKTNEKKNTEKYITNFAICYIKNRDLKRIEHEWNSIIYNGLKRIVNLNSQKKGTGEHAQAILSNSDYNGIFKKDVLCAFENGMLIIEYDLPSKSVFYTIKEYKQISSSNEVIARNYPDSHLKTAYERALYAISLRSIYEVFVKDKSSKIKATTFNGYITEKNDATGLPERRCVMSVQVERDKFMKINLAEVDPVACFKGLKGVSASKLVDLSPVSPILTFNKEDKRFIEGRDIEVNQGTNLASMHWEDFEQLVRELFELEFARNGGEVRVTQASRDGGVDAVIFDPDPLRGGKIIVQAKRYTNTVGVSAVRDLYGTIINEGANSGILITTSNYGHDSYEFAKDKPLKLLNGGHLLALLNKNGRKGYINIQEAKEQSLL